MDFSRLSVVELRFYENRYGLVMKNAKTQLIQLQSGELRNI